MLHTFVVFTNFIYYAITTEIKKVRTIVSLVLNAQTQLDKAEKKHISKVLFRYHT